jgi:hypothetical protein
MNADLLSVARATGSSGSVAVFIFMIVIASACRMIAQRKGRSGLLWFMLGGFFTVGALLGVILIPRARRGTDAMPEPAESAATHEEPAATVELRHARTVAFPVRDPADRHAGPTVIDEIETWLKTQ